MPNYRYQVRDANGQVNTGQLEASSLREATSLALHYGQFILDVSPISTLASPRNLLERLRQVKIEFGPSLKDILNFTNQLAVMVKAGINMRHAIGTIGQQVENTKFRRIIEEIKADVESGQPFSAALARHPKCFSTLYINMVRASELSGNFAHMLKRISQYLDQQIETRSMVRGAMIYPAIIAFMAVTATVFLLTFVLPKFTMLFAGKEALLPTPTLILMAMSDYMINSWYVLLAGVGALATGFAYGIKHPRGREIWDRVKLKIPLFKTMLRALYITRGLNTMGELVNAGVPMLETLRITAEVSGHTLYKRMWETVHDQVQQGNKIANPLSQQNLLPSNVVQMISAGEESGNLGEVMNDIAEFYSRELKATIKAVTAMIEPVMIIIMGFVVGFIAMSIILPIFKMSSLVKS